jgi:hypothetical protein
MPAATSSMVNTRKRVEVYKNHSAVFCTSILLVMAIYQKQISASLFLNITILDWEMTFLSLIYIYPRVPDTRQVRARVQFFTRGYSCGRVWLVPVGIVACGYLLYPTRIRPVVISSYNHNFLCY